MKKLLFLALAVMFSFTSCKENVSNKINKENLEIAKQRDYELNEGAPAITFDKTIHDFGVMNEGDIVETTFNFTNSGKTALIITNASSTCGCTIPEWPKEPIAPGETGTIKVAFNSSGKPNKMNKVVTLTTNTAKGKESVSIKGDVTPKPKNS